LFAFNTKPSNLSSPVCFGFGFTAAMNDGRAVSATMIGTVAGPAPQQVKKKCRGHKHQRQSNR